METGAALRVVDARYHVEETLVEDDRRRVFRARDRVFRRTVVIKGMFGDPEPVVDEFRRLRRAAHPRISAPLDIGRTIFEERGRPFWYFTQEWLSGSPLAREVGRIEPVDLLDCARDLLELVAFLHDSGLNRLDLKPAHILRSPRGWCLIDLDQAREAGPLQALELHGTLAYAAPEVLGGESIGPLSDLYSVGAVLYEAMTGHPRRLHGETLEEIRRFLEDAPPPSLPERWGSEAPALCSLVRTLLASRPSDRPANAAAARDLLDDSARGRFPWRSRCPPPTPRLAGREGVLQALEDAVEAALEREGGAVVVAGPSGSGRTRLLVELKDKWQAAGHPVFLLGARDPGAAGGCLPPVADYLRARAGVETGTASRSEAGPNGTQVTELLELGLRAAERLDASPRILLDDASELGTHERSALERVLSYLPGSRLVVVLAVETSPASFPGEQGASSPVSSGSTWSRTLSAMRRVTLGPLEEDSVRALSEEVLGAGILQGSRPLEELVRLTGGWPVRILHCLSFLWRNPGARLDAWRWEDASALAASALARLSPRCTALLRHLACLEIPFDLPVARVIQETLPDAPTGGNPGQPVETALEELVAAGFLSRSVRNDKAYFQLQDRILQVAMQESLGDRAPSFHLRVAEALDLATTVHDLPIPPAEIARRYMDGQMPARALPHLKQAVEHAEEREDWHESAGLHALLITGLEQLGKPVAVQRQRRADALEKVHLYQEAREELEAAREDAASLTSHQHARVLAALGRILTVLGSHEAARQRLEQALELLRDGTDATGHTVVAHRLAWLHFEMGHLDSAQDILVRLPHPPPNEQTLHLDRLHLDATLAIRTGNLPPAMADRLEKGASLAEQVGRPDLALTLTNCLVDIHRRQGDRAATGAAFEELVERAYRHHDLAREAAARHNHALWLGETGDPERAAHELERAAALYDRLGHAARATRNRLTLVELLLEAGRLDHARTLLQQTRDAVTAGNDTVTTLGHALLETRLQRLDGQNEGLDAVLASLRERMQQAGLTEMGLEALAERMTLALAAGRNDVAVRLSVEAAGDLEKVADRRLTERIHRLAAEAHQNLAAALAPPGVPRAGTPPAPTLPAPPDHADLWIERITELLHVADSEAELAARLARLAGDIVHGRGLVLLFDGSRPQVVRGHGDFDEDLGDISETVLERVRSTRRPYTCPDILASSEMSRIRSLRARNVRSLVCHPVLRDNACIGVIYVDHGEPREVARPHVTGTIGRIAVLAADFLERIARSRRTEIEPSPVFGLLGESPPMLELRRRLEAYARSTRDDLTILFLGETGTGKSVVARALHEQGRRNEGPFVPANCAAMPTSLFPSQMFGHVKGAFTGAVTSQPGLFELARGGTLFLDEIGELPLQNQAALLEPLGGTRRFRPLGAAQSQERQIDFHLFCATTRDLEEAVKRRDFRSELLRRINVNVCRIPPLRERGAGDIDLITGTLLAGILGEHAPVPKEWVDPSNHLTRRALAFLHEYDWPHNVAQLENLFKNEMIRQVLTQKGGGRVERNLLEEALGQEARPAIVPLPGRADRGPPPGLTNEALDAWWRQTKSTYFFEVYEQQGRNVTRTARALECGRDLVYKFVPAAGKKRS